MKKLILVLTVSIFTILSSLASEQTGGPLNGWLYVCSPYYASTGTTLDSVAIFILYDEKNGRMAGKIKKTGFFSSGWTEVSYFKRTSVDQWGNEYYNSTSRNVSVHFDFGPYVSAKIGGDFKKEGLACDESPLSKLGWTLKYGLGDRSLPIVKEILKELKITPDQSDL